MVPDCCFKCSLIVVRLVAFVSLSSHFRGAGFGHPTRVMLQPDHPLALDVSQIEGLLINMLQARSNGARALKSAFRYFDRKKRGYVTASDFAQVTAVTSHIQSNMHMVSHMIFNKLTLTLILTLTLFGCRNAHLPCGNAI